MTKKEVIECILNMDRTPINDPREDHQTDPPTLWLISETNHRRRLKVIFMVKEGNPIIKSAYEPEPEAERIWQKKAPYLPE